VEYLSDIAPTGCQQQCIRNAILKNSRLDIVNC